MAQQRAASCPSLFHNSSRGSSCNYNNSDSNHNSNVTFFAFGDGYDDDDDSGFEFGGSNDETMEEDTLSLLHSAILDHDDQLNREVDELFDFQACCEQ